MKHEALAMYVYRYPFDIPVKLGILHLETDHIPLHRPIIERFANSIIVEIAILTDISLASMANGFGRNH